MFETKPKYSCAVAYGRPWDRWNWRKLGYSPEEERELEAMHWELFLEAAARRLQEQQRDSRR